ncbi:MAG: hypothetical protein GWN11_06740, partial [Candidatus Dadabacteria bacterium]|nr:hypothetical protein [Candidatus Dadabacteria bacterium]
MHKFISLILGFLFLILFGINVGHSQDIKPAPRQVDTSKEAARVYNNRGLLYLEKRLYDNAIKDFDKAI